MKSQRAERVIKDLLSQAGVIVNGRRPWDIQVINERFYERVLAGGTLAAGEAYMDGWWEVERLDEFFHRLLRAEIHSLLARDFPTRLRFFTARLLNRQTLKRSRDVAERHYNLGEDFFAAMLGRRMTYTCAYWEGARNLDEAEEAKLELICRKLELRPGMSVLELGCGWGSFAKYAAEKHGVRVLGINIAERQVRLARTLCQGLPVEFRVQDYRQVEGRFDRVVSIGLMEHIGPKNHRTYMENAAARLKDDGIAFIHAICQNQTAYHCEPWFDRYIFPNAVTPSVRQLGEAMEGFFVLEDCHNIGPHYDPTLMAWHSNLARAWPSLQSKYGERFYRMMRYYLLSSAGCFRARRSQVLQLVLTKTGRLQPKCRVSAPAASEEASP